MYIGDKNEVLKMVIPDRDLIILAFLIKKGIIKDMEEWNDFRREYIKDYNNKINRENYQKT
jgi:hypothetical protein